MTVKELAGRLEVGLSTVYSLLATGQIRHRRIGKARGVIRIDEDAYQDYLARVERAAEGGGLANPPPPPTRSAGFKELDGERLLASWRRRGAKPGPPGGRNSPTSS